MRNTNVAGGLAAFLAGIDQFGARLAIREEARVSKVVIHDHIGFMQAPNPAEGYEAGIARPCADQIDLPLHPCFPTPHPPLSRKGRGKDEGR